MADELIKRDAILRELYGYAKVGFAISNVTLSVIKEAPAVDAVEVVRCKDCIFWDRKRISCEGLARCATGEGGIRYRSHSDYCSKGKCKDGRDEA